MNKFLQIFAVSVAVFAIGNMAFAEEDGVGELPPLEITAIEKNSHVIEGLMTWRGTEDLQGSVVIDLFAAWPTITNDFKWVGMVRTFGPSTNIHWQVFRSDLNALNMPDASFILARERSTTASSMNDWDKDLLPDIYEVNNGTNPFVQDFDDAAKLTVGTNGMYQTIRAAVNASVPYSIIHLPYGESVSENMIALPEHPVMIVGPTNGMAHIKSQASPYLFGLELGQDYETIFQNLYIEMEPSRTVQAAFWCGAENLVASSDNPGAAATFRNVYVRAMGSSGMGYGWSFRRVKDTPVELRKCVINAEGSSAFTGVYSLDGPKIVLEDCTFINFPGLGGGYRGVGIEVGAQNTTQVGGEIIMKGCVFDNSFTNAYALGRVDAGYIVKAENTIVPRMFPIGDAPDESIDIFVASNCVAWAGHAIAGGQADVLGIGALAAIDSSSIEDTDRDGLRDWEEAYQYETNPFAYDTDGDGVGDGTEVGLGTDPRNRMSYLAVLTMLVTNSISNVSITNYYGIAASSSGWDVERPCSCVQNGSSQMTTNAVHGLYFKAFADLNGNGSYEAEYDVLLTKAVPQNCQEISLEHKLGDVDGDGIDDLQERIDGTDPYSARSLKIRRSVRINNTDYSPSISDYYQFAASTNDIANTWNLIGSSQATVSSSVLVENGECALIVYRDFNANGVYDEGIDGLKIFPVRQGASVLDVSIGDTDGDGVRDRLELTEGTDPLNKLNFRVLTEVCFEPIDISSGITNYVQVAVNNSAGHSDAWQAIPDAAVMSVNIDGVATNGVFYGIYFRDVNGNGQYDEDIDVFKSTAFTGSKSRELCGVLIGDCDGDGVGDIDEIACGTSVYSDANYCFDVDVLLEGMYAAGLNMKAALINGGVDVLPPMAVSNSTLRIVAEDVVVQNRNTIMVRVWEDLNDNNLLDNSERKAVLNIKPRGHETQVSIRMPLGEFDKDGDGMHDDWERAYGLDPHDASDSVDDMDGDGLINLHEFYAFCDPRTYDGTNTAIHAFCQAIDTRVNDTTKTMGTYVSGLNRNPSCWAYGIDTTCASPYNSNLGAWKAGTAISKRHIAYATHYRIAVGATIRFITATNESISRQLVAEKVVTGTDITIGLLSSDLPDDICVAKFLPDDFASYIGDATRIPMLMYNAGEDAIVTDSNRLDIYQKVADGLVPEDTKRRHFFKQVVSGDSGDPKFFIAGTEPILVCTLTTYGTGSSGQGPFMTYYRDRIQTVMNSLCPGYALQLFDFSGYRRLFDED